MIQELGHDGTLSIITPNQFFASYLVDGSKPKRTPVNYNATAIKSYNSTSYKDIFEEVRQTLNQVKSLTCDNEVPPQSIAILLCNRSLYLPVMKQQVKNDNTPFQFIEDQSVIELEVGQWVLHLTNYLESPTTKHKERFSSHPISSTWIHKQEANASSHRGGEVQLPQSLSTFLSTGGHEKHPADYWRDSLTNIMYEFEILEKDSSPPKDFRAYKLLSNIDEMLSISVRKLSKIEIIKIIREQIKFTTFPLTHITKNCVHIMSIDDCLNTPFDHAFVLGCTQDNLPKKALPINLLDTWVERSIGIYDRHSDINIWDQKLTSIKIHFWW